MENGVKKTVLKFPEKYRQSNHLCSINSLLGTSAVRSLQGFIACWNQLMPPQDEIDWSEETLRKRHLSVEMPASTFLKNVGYKNQEGVITYDSEQIDEGLLQLFKTTFDVLTVKESFPELYNAIVNIHPDKKVEWDSYFINLFESCARYVDGTIHFVPTLSAIPLFDSIASYYTIMSLDSVATLSDSALKFYLYFKTILGSSKEKTFTLWYNPSETNPTNNVRFILNIMDKNSKKEYKKYHNQEKEFFSKLLIPAFESINDETDDIRIGYIKGSKNEGYSEQFVRKNKKIVGVKINLVNIALKEELEQEVPRKKYKDLSFLAYDYLSKYEIDAIITCIEADFFKNRHYDPEYCTEALWQKMKISYLELAYAKTYQRYFNKESGKFTCHSVGRTMLMFIAYGADIYDGLNYVKGKTVTWAAIDSYKRDKAYQESPINKNEILINLYREKENQIGDEDRQERMKEEMEMPDFVRDFLRSIK